MLNFKIKTAIAAIGLASLTWLTPPAQAAEPVPARNVVLVHGAWADGSSWSRVIHILQAHGLKVTAVQNRLTSLADADADVRWALARQDGPTVLVGHSWSGTVLSDIGDAEKVSALVYVAARAPEAGEDFAALQRTFPDTPVRAGVKAADGFTTLSKAAFLSDFANGVAERDALALYAAQQPTAAALFAERTTATAWKDKPTYYAVAKDDRTISPEFERFLAKRMDATTTIEIESGHLPMVSHPQEVADLILKAAGITD